MAKKKTRMTPATPSAPAKKNNIPRWEKFAFIGALAVIAVWVFIPNLIPIPAAAKAILRIAALVIIGLKVVAAIRDTSISELFSDVFGRFRKEKPEVEEPEADNDDDDASPEKPADELLADPAKNAWTLLTVKDKDGNDVIGYGERVKLDPTKAPAGKVYNPDKNIYEDAPKAAAPKHVDKAKEKIERLMALGYSLDDAMDLVEKSK